MTKWRSSIAWWEVVTSPAVAAAASTSSTPSQAQGNQPLVPAWPSRRTRSFRRRLPGPSSSATIVPPGASTLPRRSKSCSGSPPMPTFPSKSRAVCHPPSLGRGSKTDRTRASPPRWRVDSTAPGATSMPTASMPRWASRATRRPGPHPTSRTGPTASDSSFSSTAEQSSHQRCALRATRWPVLVVKVAVLKRPNLPARFPLDSKGTTSPPDGWLRSRPPYSAASS